MSMDRTVEDTFYLRFLATVPSTQLPGTLGGVPVVSAYEDGSDVQITAGITLGVDHDSVTGLNLLTIVATDANGFEAGKDYDLVITTGTVGGENVVGTVVGHFSLELSAAVKRIGSIGSGATGAVNIQATEDNTGGAIIDGVTFVGSVQSGTFANTEAEDGVYHDIDDVGSDIDIVYGYAVGGGRTAAELMFAGFVQGNGDEIKIKAYDHVGADWEVIGTVPGQNGVSNFNLILPLLLKHTGIGSELGNVYIRFETDSTTPSNLSVDKLLVASVNIGQSVGYANGQVWVDTPNGVAGTEAFVNGVADQPVDLWTSALTLGAAVGLTDFHIINGSTIQLTGASANFSIFGDNWILDLNGQSVADAYFQGAHVSGVGVSTTEVHYEGCDVDTTSVQIGHFDFCSFSDVLTMTLAGDYNFHDCYSKVPGASAPIFTKTPGQAITAQWRRWSGGLTLSNIEAGDVFTISGEMGTITLNGADGTVEIRGTYRHIVDNRTGSPTLNTDGAIQGVDVATILGETAGIVDIPTVAEFNARTLSAAQIALQVALLEGAVTGATTGTPTTTVIDTDLSETEYDQYVGRTLIFLDGDLAKQATAIEAYDGATKELQVVATTSAVAAGVNFIVV